MKSKKHLLCIILVIALLCSSQSTVFAASMGNTVEHLAKVADTNEILLSENEILENI